MRRTWRLLDGIRIGALAALLLPGCKVDHERKDVPPANPLVFKAARARLDEINAMLKASENTSLKCAGAMAYVEELQHDPNAEVAALRTAIEKTCGYSAPLAGILRDLDKIERADGGHWRECAEIQIYLDDFGPQHRPSPEVKALREKYRHACE
jgi:hypothetical protein